MKHDLYSVSSANAHPSTPTEQDAHQAKLLPHMRKQSPFYTLARARRVLAALGVAASLLAMGFVVTRFVQDGRTGSSRRGC